METPQYRIGIVGTGRMGANMARRLHERDYRLTAVYDTNRACAADLARELGCQQASSPREVAHASNTVITVVSDDQAMDTIFHEQADDSLLHHAADRLFINCATVSPHVHSQVQDRVERRGGLSLEACMASSIPQARNGTLYLMCGGQTEAFARAEPLLHVLGTTVTYVGPAGEAAKLKALVNMVMNINTAGLAEGLGLADALGLDLAVVREVFSHTGAASRVLETDGDDMVNRDHDCYFSVEHAAKDSGIALALAEQAHVATPLAAATFQQYSRLVERGSGHLDKSAVSELTFPHRASETP